MVLKRSTEERVNIGLWQVSRHFKKSLEVADKKNSKAGDDGNRR